MDVEYTCKPEADILEERLVEEHLKDKPCSCNIPLECVLLQQNVFSYYAEEHLKDKPCACNTVYME